MVVIAAYNGPVIHQVVQWSEHIRTSWWLTTAPLMGRSMPRRTQAPWFAAAVNLGQDAALQTGIARALRQGAELVATFDADGQHDIADLERMIDLQRSSGVDCVLGSRFLGSTEEMPRQRAVILKAAVLYTRLTSGLKESDAHNGFRLLTRRAALAIRIQQNRMAHASEIIDEIKKHELSWLEAPVKVRYTDYSRSKGQRTSAAAKILIDLMMARLGR
jgi:glycosyltransferase involved in cell wall biosynthesis